MGHIGTFSLVILILGLIWASWFFSGGTERSAGRFESIPAQSATSSSFSWELFFQSFRTSPVVETSSSFFTDTVNIISTAGAKYADPNREYIELGISPPNNGGIGASGW